MQVGSSTSLSAQLQALENAALGQYQTGQDFSLLLQTADAGTKSAGAPGSAAGAATSTANGTIVSTGGGPVSDKDGQWQISGTFQSSSLIAVGSFGPDGKMIPFSQQQIQSEEDAVAKAGKSAYSDALENFMTLSQAGGQISQGTFTDHQSYTSGLVAANFDTSLSLKPVGGGTPSDAS